MVWKCCIILRVMGCLVNWKPQKNKFLNSSKKVLVLHPSLKSCFLKKSSLPFPIQFAYCFPSVIPKYSRHHPQQLHMRHTDLIKLSKTLALCKGITPLSCLIYHPLKMNTDSALQHSCLAPYFLFYIWFFLPSCGFHWIPSYLFQTLILIYPEYFEVCPVCKTFITPFSWAPCTIFISIFKFIT